MKQLFLLFVLALSSNLTAQPDSLSRKFTYGCSAGLVNFVDYALAKENLSDKMAYYQGLDLGVFIRNRKGNFQLDMGVMGGDKYPLAWNLNYYLGAAYLFYSGKRKYVFEIHPRVMYAYYTDDSPAFYQVVRKEFSIQLGAGAYRKLKRTEIGVCYYLWGNDEKVIFRREEPFFEQEKLHRKGLLPIGILQLSARYRFN